MIHLCTGITPNYLPRAQPYLDSLAQHANVAVTIFAVNFGTPLHQFPCILVDYSQAVVRLPKMMLQHGGFTQFAPPEWASDHDIIIFTDADAILQRRFTDDELAFFAGVPDNTFAVGYNMPNEEQTLGQEAARIFPRKPLDEIARIFPGSSSMKCRNFGFVVARLSSWKELFKRTIALEPDCCRCFDNPARVQWMSLYAAQCPGLAVIDLPDTIHGHGHCGLRKGLEKGADGLWRQDGVVVAFAHAL